METIIEPDKQAAAALQHFLREKARWITPQIVMIGAAVLDLVGTWAVSMAIAYYYPGFDGNKPGWMYFWFGLLAGGLVVSALAVARCYTFGSLLTPFQRLPALVASWISAFAFLLAIIFALKDGGVLSRVWLVSLSISGLMFFLAWRFVYGGVLRRLNSDGHFNKLAVLVGGGDNANHVISIIKGSQDAGISLLGIFDDRGDDRVGTEVNGLRKLGRIDDLVAFVRANPVDTLILTLPTTAENRLAQIVDKLWVLPVNIRLSAATQTIHFTRRSYTFLGNLPCLDLYDKPLGEWGPLIKAVLDKIIATAAIILLSPVFLATALAVRLESKGPILFVQKRYGFNNELIKVYKFRSMYADKSDATASKLVVKGDPRVTKVGRFIRRTTIDELPQLFNVLKGELSLVGPRPHATQAKAGSALYEQVVSGYFARHRVKPGLTGWAQVNGWRGETDTVEKIERRIECDLYYIDNWSLTFDLYILARTPFALLNTKNAY